MSIGVKYSMISEFTGLAVGKTRCYFDLRRLVLPCSNGEEDKRENSFERIETCELAELGATRECTYWDQEPGR